MNFSMLLQIKVLKMDKCLANKAHDTWCFVKIYAASDILPMAGLLKIIASLGFMLVNDD